MSDRELLATRSTHGPALPPTGVRMAVQEVLHSPGKLLDPATRGQMEQRFGSDFSQVRVHTDDTAARTAKQLDAAAYTVGGHVAFAQDAYAPDSAAGKKLLAHELAHVVQQGGGRTAPDPDFRISPESDPHERAADVAAEQVMHGSHAPELTRATGPMLQRKIEIRDVLKPEESGFARLPEFLARLNTVSGGLKYSLAKKNLAYEVLNAATLTNFDRQMMGFIDQEPVIPMPLANHKATIEHRESGDRAAVNLDSWHYGYLDVDDFLASSDLGAQLILLHILRERSETKDYAKRVGSRSMFTAEADDEKNRAHQTAYESEADMLRGYFDDQSIRPDYDRVPEGFDRAYRNDVRDRFLVRIDKPEAGIEAVSLEVMTRDRVMHTPEEYLQIRAAKRAEDEEIRKLMQDNEKKSEDENGVPAP